MAKKGHFLLGVVIGSVAAASAAYLFAPEKAEDLRKKAAKKQQTAKDSALKLYHAADEATADWRSDAAKKVATVLNDHEGLQTALSSSSEKLQQLKQEFQGATDQMKDQLDDVSEQLKSSFEETKDAADFDDIVLDEKSAFKDEQKPAPKAPVTPEAPEPKVDAAATKPEAPQKPAPDPKPDKFSFDETDPKLDANPSDNK